MSLNSYKYEFSLDDEATDTGRYGMSVSIQDDSINETRPQTPDGEMKLMTLII